MSDVLVVGTGLIGTSVALGLTGQGQDVTLSDLAHDHLALALARGAGRVWDGEERARLVVLAVPPSRLPATVVHVQTRGAGRTYTHVSSVQASVQRAAEAAGADPVSLCGGHPLAGSERSGPMAASADLFAGRTWVLCPSRTSSPAALAAVRELARALGAVPVELTAAAHDEAVARVSHLPQVAASAVAAQLRDAPLITQLAGPGLVDTTRVAASDPSLWTDVLALNAGHVAPLVRRLAHDLLAVSAALEVLSPTPATGVGSAPQAPAVLAARDAVTDLLRRGNEGRDLVPLKRGVHMHTFGRVVVSVPDEPGQLAGLLVAAASAGVNVEDVRVEHVPGRPTGSIELLVPLAVAARLGEVLTGQGWNVLAAS